MAYERVPAPTDECAAADRVQSVLGHCEVFGDQGFLGANGPQVQGETQGHRIGTPTRVHPRPPHAPALHRGCHGLRERMESVFHEVQHTGRHWERLWRKTVLGVTPHVIAQRARPTLKHLLRRSGGIDVQTDTAHPL